MLTARSWEDIPFGPGPSLGVTGELPLPRLDDSRGRHRRLARPRVRVCIRRRRVLATIGAGLALALALGASGLDVAWWAAMGIAAVGMVYLALLFVVRHLAVKQSLSARTDAARSRQVEKQLQPWALARFLLSLFLGWSFTPLALLAERFAGGAASGSRRQQWLNGCQRLRDYGRQHALKALSLTVVATAGAASLGAFTGGVAAAASPLAPQAVAAPTYIAPAGSTLSSISRHFGVSVSTLASENGIKNPNLIYAGQVLKIAPKLPTTYRVRSGDTLSSISRHFGVSVASLVSVNGIRNPNVIVVGQVLHIGGSAPVASHPATYRVQRGDTLSSISRRFGVSVATLVSINGISNPNMIRAGQGLRLRGAPAVVHTVEVTAAVTSTTTATTATSTPNAAEAVRVALDQVGRPYVYGGASPSQGFDCSGLIEYAWAAGGVSLPHYSVSQYEDTTRISESELEPGDIVFYNNGSGPQPGHEAMYIGDGRVVASNLPGTDVQTQPLTWAGPIIGFGRVR